MKSKTLLLFIAFLVTFGASIYAGIQLRKVKQLTEMSNQLTHELEALNARTEILEQFANKKAAEAKIAERKTEIVQKELEACQECEN